jgi:hypothetical protein
MSGNCCATISDRLTMSDYKRSDSIDIFIRMLGICVLNAPIFTMMSVLMIPKLHVTETWLNDSFCNRSLFPDDYFVFRADRVYTDFSLTRGGSVLTAVYQSLSGCKRRYDLEMTSECVWIEIPLPDIFNLLFGNHYFSPNTDVRVIENYFNSLEIKLNPQNFRVVLLGDFNVSGFDWANSFPQANSYYYTKIRGDVVHSAACYLGLSQYNLAIKNKNLLDLVFANFSCVNVMISNLNLVEPDAFHPSLVIDLSSTIVSSHSQPCRLSRDYARADCSLQNRYLSSYDWSCGYNQSSSDSAVNQLKSVVTDVLNLAIPNKLSRKSKFPC